MKKLTLFTATVLCLLLFSNINAQTKNITAAAATKEKGYTVLNPTEPIVIYKYQHLTHSPKEAEKYKPVYFFTTKPSDVLQPLTKDNLKKAFPENHPFHDALDAQFDSDNNLSDYDSFHKMYKIDHIYMSTVKN